MSKEICVQKSVTVIAEGMQLPGLLSLPQTPKGCILFAHGSGSSHHSPRNKMVAEFFFNAGFATLLFDLLTKEEEVIDNLTQELRFNIPFLAHRLLGASYWVEKESAANNLAQGFFGASTGAAAALNAAAEMGEKIKAVVSRGGRPDLAGQSIERVKAPTLLIVGGEDHGVIELNQQAFDRLNCIKKLEIIPKATHLFEQPGALEEVGKLASLWFSDHF